MRFIVRKSYHPLINFTFVFAILFYAALSGAASGITYHGKLLKPDNTPVSSANTQFRIQIRSPGSENCLLWEEQQTKNLSSTNGVFTITINDTNEPSIIPNILPFQIERVFSNRTAFTGLTCASGTSYTPSSGVDGRVLQVFFREQPTDPWEQMPLTKINFVPLSLNSVQLAGYQATEFLKIDPASTQTPLTTGQVTTLLDLVTGNYLKAADATTGDLGGTYGATIVDGIRGVGVDATAPTLNQVLKFNGTVWAPANEGAPGDASYAAKGVVQIQTDLATSGLNIAAGILSMPNVITAGGPTGNAQTIPVITYDAKGRLTAVTTATVDDTTKLSLDGSDTMTGALNMGNQNITNANSVSSTGVGTRTLTIYDADNSNYATLQVPSVLAANYALTLPADDGTAGQVLSTDGNGVLSWIANGSGGVSGTGTINNIPKFTSAGAIGDSLISESGTVISINGNLNLPDTSSTTGQIRLGGTSFAHNYSGVFVGDRAGNFTNSSWGNVGIGDFSLDSLTSGEANTAVGGNALGSNSAGDWNTALGYDSMTQAYGNSNTAAGFESMRNSTGGNNNAGFGAFVMHSVGGSDNSAVGYYALGSLSSGSNNVAVGERAGYLPFAVSTGSQNTFIGSRSGLASGTQRSNATAIGYGATVDASNALVLGNSSVNVGIGSVTNPTARLDFSGDLNIRGIAAPSLSATSQGKIYFDSTANKFKVSENGGAYVDLVGAGGGSSSGTAGHIQFSNGSGGFSSDSNQLFWDATNDRFGIGTIFPDAQFDLEWALNTFEIGQAAAVYHYSANGMNLPSPIYTMINEDLTNGQGQGLRIIAGNGASDFPLKVENNGSTTELFNVRGDGRIGIGTAAPAGRLTLQQSGVSMDDGLMILPSAGGSARIYNDGGGPVLNAAGGDIAKFGSTAIETFSPFWIWSNDGDFVSVAGQTNGNHRWSLNLEPSNGSFNIIQQGGSWASEGTRMTIDRSGNVGIGTTTPASPLEVTSSTANTTAAFSNTNTSGTKGALSAVTSGAGTTNIGGSFAATGGTTNKAIEIVLTPSGANNYAIYSSVNAQSFFNGNIGIGTTSPNTSLDVLGAFSMREMAAPALSPTDQGRIYFDSTANKFRVSENGGAYVDLVSSGGTISGLTTNRIPKANSSTTLVDSILTDSNNKIGVGVSPSNNYTARLQVGMESNGSSNAIFGLGGQGVSFMHSWPGVMFNSAWEAGSVKNLGVGYGGRWMTNPSTGELSWVVSFLSSNPSGAAAGSTLDIENIIFRISNSGYIGLGTSSISAGLHNNINSASNMPAERLSGTWFSGGTSTSTKPQLLIEPSGTTSNAWNTNGTGIGVNAANTFTGNLLDLQSNGVSRLSVQSNGNVGIGTTSPNTSLDVVGAFSMREMAAPALSPADQGRIYFDSTANKFKVSENGGAYVDLVGAGGGSSSGTAGHIQFSDGSSGFSSDSNNLFWDATNDRLGVGTATPTHRVHFQRNVNDANAILKIENQSSGSSAEATIAFSNDTGEHNWLWLGSSTYTTTNMRNRLNLQGDSAGVSLISSQPTGDIRFYTDGSNDSRERMRINGTGQVMIGTTTASSKFNVTAGAAAEGMSLRSGNVANRTWYSLGRTSDEIQLGVVGTANDFYAGTNPGDAVLKNNSSNKIFLGTNSLAPEFTIEPGLVGINTLYPQTNFDMDGSIQLRGISTESVPLTADHGRIYYDLEDKKFKISENGGAFVNLTGNGLPAATGSEAAPSITFVGDPNTGFYHGGDGNIYISNNGVDSAHFDDFGFEFYRAVGLTNGTAGNPALFQNLDFTTGLFFPATGSVALSTAGSERLRITNTGNVGIGTTNPSSPLDVEGQIQSRLRLKIDFNGANNPLFQGTALGNEVASIWTVSSNGQLRLSAAGTETVRLTSSGDSYLNGGNVGIGTSTPSAKLEVAGDIKTTGRIVANVSTDADALSALTVDFTSTNTIRATGASANCGTLNVTNTTEGGSFTLTILNATTSCSTIQWNGATTNVKLPAGYSGGASVAGIVYTFLDDGLTLWVSAVPF